MKLADIRGEEALDVIADLIDPIAKIAQDENVVKNVRSGNKLKAVKILLKEHKRSVIEIMARLEGEDPDKYKPSILQLPVKVIEILNDPDIAELFQSEDTVTSSGSVTENIEASGQ